MEELNKILNNYRKISKSDYLTDEVLEDLKSVYPFNKFEYIISNLLADNIITLDDYFNIRDEYIKRNKYLHLFELAPRTFGETWGQNHLSELVQELEKPSKKNDPSYMGQYDFIYKGIKIEVKGSRAVDKDRAGEELVLRALPSFTRKKFDMNFQQIKPNCCDVFVWFTVWTDKITYWVLKNDEVSNNQYYSKGQHRGNVGEGQLWITEKNIKSFDEYLVDPKNILDKIVEKYNLPIYAERIKKSIINYAEANDKESK